MRSFLSILFFAFGTDGFAIDLSGSSTVSGSSIPLHKNGAIIPFSNRGPRCMQALVGGRTIRTPLLKGFMNLGPGDSLVRKNHPISVAEFQFALRMGIHPSILNVEMDLQEDPDWWSPEQRWIVPLAEFSSADRDFFPTNISSRDQEVLNASFQVSLNEDFQQIIREVAKKERHMGFGTTPQMLKTYEALYEQEMAHSLEVRDSESGLLLGGGYGIYFEGAFSGLKIFSRNQANAREIEVVAFYHLVQQLQKMGLKWVEVQILPTALLRGAGGVEVSRQEYLDLLQKTRKEASVLFLD